MARNGKERETLESFGGCSCGKASTYVFAGHLIHNAEVTTIPNIQNTHIFHLPLRHYLYARSLMARLTLKESVAVSEREYGNLA